MSDILTWHLCEERVAIIAPTSLQSLANTHDISCPGRIPNFVSDQEITLLLSNYYLQNMHIHKLQLSNYNQRLVICGFNLPKVFSFTL